MAGKTVFVLLLAFLLFNMAFAYTLEDVEDKLAAFSGSQVSCRGTISEYECTLTGRVDISANINDDGTYSLINAEGPSIINRLPKQGKLPVKTSPSLMCGALNLEDGISCSYSDGVADITVTKLNLKGSCAEAHCTGHVVLMGQSAYPFKFTLADDLSPGEGDAIRQVRLLKEGGRQFMEGSVVTDGGQVRVRMPVKALKARARLLLAPLPPKKRAALLGKIRQRLGNRLPPNKRWRILTAMKVKPVNFTMDGSAVITFEVSREDAEDAKVFHILDNDDVEEVPFNISYEGDTAIITVEANSFSIYALATVAPLQENEGEELPLPSNGESKPFCALGLLIPIAMALTEKGKRETV